MNVCNECGKAMATRGGLEIHMELSHGAPKAPLVAPAVVGMPAAAGAAVPQRAIAAPRPYADEWRLPSFLRGIDSTLPLTALLVVVLLLSGIVAAVHRSSPGTPAAAGSQGAAAAGTPTAPVDPAADQKLAQSLVLTPTDCPDGWTSTPHVTSPTDAQDTRLAASCPQDLAQGGAAFPVQAPGDRGRQPDHVVGGELVALGAEEANLERAPLSFAPAVILLPGSISIFRGVKI